MDMQEYWKAKQLYYEKADWIKSPTYFVKFAITYFPPNAKVLELGAGQGADARFLTRQGYEVVSTDISDTALNISKNNAKDESINNIEFLKVDMTKPLPFDDQTFDIVYANLSIHYFTDDITDQLFNEIYRILTPSGILAYSANSTSDPEINGLKKIDDYLYTDEQEHLKRYFDLEYSKDKAENKFDTIILDNRDITIGQNNIKHLIRFIGRKK